MESAGFFRKAKSLMSVGFFEIDQDGDAFAALGLEDGAQEAGEAEGREASGDGVHGFSGWD